MILMIFAALCGFILCQGTEAFVPGDVLHRRFSQTHSIHLQAMKNEPLRLCPYISTLEIRDVIDVWMLASQEFTPLCSNYLQALSLNVKIFLYSFAKLSSPKLWGHTIYGLKTIEDKRLIGMIDLSAQDTRSGSLNALRLTTLSTRLVKAKLSQPPQANSKENALQPYICNLLIAKNERRKGYAQMLLNHCATVIRAQGFSSLNLHVQSSDIAALTLYLKFGFQVDRSVGKEVLFLRKVFPWGILTLKHW